MDITPTDKSYQFLINIGFSLNEAKVFLALIKSHLLNGYEVAKKSGVSRSLVYDVLERLVKKGFVIKVQGENNLYSAKDFNEVLDIISKNNQDNLKKAKEKLKEISSNNVNNNLVYNLSGFDNLILKAKELITNAKKEISLSIWEEEFNLIKDELIKAISRGVKVYIFSFSKINLENAFIYSYNIKDPNNLFPYRRLTIIVDNYDILIGENISKEGISLITNNHALVSLAIDEMVLNIFWYKLIKKYNLLQECESSQGFLHTLNNLRKELDIDTNMTKNFIVFNFQKGGLFDEWCKNRKTKN